LILWADSPDVRVVNVGIGPLGTLQRDGIPVLPTAGRIAVLDGPSQV
jgi:hypothetical protein